MTDAEGAAGADLTAAIRAAYDANGAAWDDGPRRIYDQLAVALLDAASTSYAGAHRRRRGRRHRCGDRGVASPAAPASWPSTFRPAC